MARGPRGAPVSADMVADRVKDARARGVPLRIAGGGSWLGAGQPCAADERLDIGAHAGIVHYEPGDLTLTARAGTTLAEIDAVTREHGQWLTLDAPGASTATLGATIATASAGPLSSAYGTPRDHVLGCEFVSGTGDVLRAGGRVVKNVAGFDLVRLVTGAWGTIGVITEATVRLRARPAVDRTLLLRVDAPSAQAVAATLARALRQSAMTPLAAELLSPSLAVRLGCEGVHALVRWGGNATFVRAAAEESATMGTVEDAAVNIWRSLGEADGVDDLTVRVSGAPSRLGELWLRASAFAEGAGGFAHATVSRGIVRCIVPRTANTRGLDAGLRALASDATVVGERLDASHWPAIAQSRNADALRASVRRAFDPDNVLNPGILGLA